MFSIIWTSQYVDLARAKSEALLIQSNAHINVNPVGGGGGGECGQGVGIRQILIFFLSNSPGWETEGQSKVSKKSPPQGILYKTNKRTFQTYVLTTFI